MYAYIKGVIVDISEDIVKFIIFHAVYGIAAPVLFTKNFIAVLVTYSFPREYRFTVNGYTDTAVAVWKRQCRIVFKRCLIVDDHSSAIDVIVMGECRVLG